ncbi:hypothetical protein BM221_010475 [Beauveria bassiana]|uniref:Uncharacterized protein n=1 Tax=Beauveria bassiana TaxID=176275 RepID=A0A2N6N8X4_BEABA|nr:hypothetical protein BM221_010475 [Beauveria bassiana]
MSLLTLKTRRSAVGTSDCQQIFFLHPGYPDGHDLLLSLPAFDSRDDQYPVVPSYENFRCPTTLPESWAAESPHIKPTATDDVS